MIQLFVAVTVMNIIAGTKYVDKLEFCATLNCDSETKAEVCGLREDGEGFQFKLFKSICDLMKFGCNVGNDNEAYGLINLEYCKEALLGGNKKLMKHTVFEKSNIQNGIKKKCTEFDCSYPGDSKLTCGIRKDDKGYRVRLFETKCQLLKFNCVNEVQFESTDLYICDGLEVYEDSDKPLNSVNKINVDTKNLFIVDATPFNFNNNINDTIDNFFATTHLFDLPVKEISSNLEEGSRRMILSQFRPQKVFKPWITIPKNRSDDHWHIPTLATCYHKCPTKCPETYAPVCGVPGIEAREPSLMFQNHCYMDVAQCKMYWEDKSETSQASTYIESPFVFCLGDQMEGLFRFMPLVRTLQHMGRLKRKGHFRYKLKNLRFYNNLLWKEPKYMG